MIAKGAHKVRAHERPTEATMKVAAAGEVMKKVENMARAKKAWAQAHVRDILLIEGVFVRDTSFLLYACRIRGRAMLHVKAVIAKRKLAKVPKRMASVRSGVVVFGAVGSALSEVDISFARNWPAS